ncbi:helix-turn-helix domain-containing protein [uncultured Methanobacterium sp.]|uniref:helix-turn-helix domain-containing protein n=1 Tax=uncultured Methanobacterium sp. TaxID=176306 RepID=UPI002AA7350D|nr:helix-turn-helix domain-containing protein [uncultured Methanobacterium sp.]
MPKHITSGLKYLAAVKLREQGYFQKDIADKLGMDRSTVSHYLNGRNLSWSSIEVAESITNCCNRDFLYMTYSLTGDLDNTRTIVDILIEQEFQAKVKDTCIGCGVCVDACLMKNISIVDLKCNINTDECCGCLECQLNCPTNSIKVLEVQNLNK